MKNINRRTFLQRSILTSAGAMLLSDQLLNAMTAGPAAKNRKLVVIQLSGGNDGLNMIVPYADNLYYKARPVIAVAKNDVLKASKYQGFNPVMKSFKSLYDQNRLTVINSVGYPNPNRSHFRSMDIWQSASDADQYLNTGWIGRYLSALPDDQRKPHKAIEVDSNIDLALKGNTITGLSMEHPEKLYDSLRRGLFRPLTKINKGVTGNPNLDYIHNIMSETVASVDYINQKTGNSKISSGAGRGKGRLFSNLSIIAGMIKAGLSTSVYYTTLSGFDTHVNQKPQQTRLLKELSEGVGSFVSELDDGNYMDDVMILIFSEFGRRVAQNASNGTDHGCANNIILIGNGLKKTGFYNDPPDLKDLDKGDIKYQVDFRSVYATILNNHLNSNADEILGGEFPNLRFV